MPDLDKAAGVIADHLNQSVRDVMPIAQALSDAGLLLPEGFVAVPREPTEAMLVAAGATPAGVMPRGGKDYMRRMLPLYWQAMIRAAAHIGEANEKVRP